MTIYPLIIRNRMPWIKVGLLLLWIGGVTMATVAATGRPLAGYEALLPYALCLFWLIALVGLIAAIRQEHPVLTITGPRQASVLRGPLHARRTAILGQLELKLEKDWDSEGGTYFTLKLADRPTPVTIAEGHRRERLDRLKAEIEAAFAR